MKEQDILDYGKTDDNARKDVLRQLLDKNELNFNNVQQAVNFLSIMLKKERIQEIIRQEINNLINECDKGSIEHNTPNLPYNTLQSRK